MLEKESLDIEQAIKQVYESLDQIRVEEGTYYLKDDDDGFIFLSSNVMKDDSTVRDTSQILIGMGAYTTGRSLDSCILNLILLKRRWHHFLNIAGYENGEGVPYGDRQAYLIDEGITIDHKRIEMKDYLIYNQGRLEGVVEKLKFVGESSYNEPYKILPDRLPESDAERMLRKIETCRRLMNI